MTAVLRISDGTTTISLINGEDGFYLNAWRPGVAQYKGGGVGQSSPLADGRRLVTRQFGNAFESFDLKVQSDGGQDSLIYHTQEIRRLLEKAVDYWATDWQNEPVWIEAQATCETNLRYALVHSYSTPSDDNPYAAPFLQHSGSAMNNWSLIIERGHWLADQPGTGTCVEVSGTKDSAIAQDGQWELWHPTEANDDCYVEGGAIDRTATFIRFGDGPAAGVADAGVRFRNVDIPNAAIITRAWVEFEAAANQAGTACNIDIAGEDVDDAAAFTTFANFNARFRTAWSVDWDAIPAWVAGTEYDTPDITGVIQTIVDRAGWASGNNLVIFFDDDGSDPGAYRDPASWDNVTYDEPLLHVEWFDESGSYSDTFGRTETCDNEVYIANKDNLAQLTHIYVDDGGVFGFNLLGDPTFPGVPANLLPAIPAVNDALYLGIATALDNSGPFCSLVFDIGTAQSDITGIAWEYWNGAWVALTVQDNTDADGAMTGVAFDTADVNSVHWLQPSDWATTTVNGIVGYWVRARVTAVGGAQTPPTQQNRWIYSIIWGDVDVDELQVAGDLPAVNEIKWYVRSDEATHLKLMYSERAVMGLRSIERGSNFVAYLNAADEQNNAGITVAASGAETAFANDMYSPTGRVATYTTAGVVAIAPQLDFLFSSTLAPEYYGVFHAFMRVRASIGADNVHARLTASTIATIGRMYQSELIYFDGSVGADLWSVVDFGQIELPPSASVYDADDTSYRLYLVVEIGCSGAATVNIYDLILIPVDEWSGDFINTVDGPVPSIGKGGLNDEDMYLDVDSVIQPRRNIRAPLRVTSTDEVAVMFRPVSNGGVILQANKDQQLWMLNMSAGTTSDWQANPSIGGSVQMVDNERYLSMRGER